MNVEKPLCPKCSSADSVVPVAGGLTEAGTPRGDLWVCTMCGHEWPMDQHPVTAPGGEA